LLRTLKQDVKTTADFRCDNRGAFKSVFRQFVLLCRRLDLLERKLVAVDGTRIKRSTTRIAISRAIRWRNSFARRTSDWTTI
jgi:transposase